MEPVVFITGSAARIGASIAHAFHAAGYFVLLHHRNKKAAAESLKEKLNQQRPNSTALISGDLSTEAGRHQIYRAIKELSGSLDVLVHNASAFYPTKVETTTEAQWDDLFNSNVKGPYFLTQSLLPLLKDSKGQIIFLGDIYAERPLEQHPVYCISKAAVIMMAQSLAKELGPGIRVNTVSPGAILWPGQMDNEPYQAAILQRTALKRTGTPLDIAKAVLFVAQSDYITGHNLRVDGGRSLMI